MTKLLSNFNKSTAILILVAVLAAAFAGCSAKNGANVKSEESPKLITDIITSDNATTTLVTVKGNQQLTYTAVKQVFPLGVLFHFPDTALDNIKSVYYPPDNELISSIRATQTNEGGKSSRIFIALKNDAPYDLTPDPDGLHISFPKTAAAAVTEPVAEEKEAAPEPEPAKKMAPPAGHLKAVTATPLKDNAIVNVKADGTIKDYKTFTLDKPARIVVDIFKVKSPYKGEQRVSVKSKFVERIRHFGHPDKVRLVIDTQSPYLSKYSASPVDNGLLIYVGKKMAPPPPESAPAAAAPASTAAPKPAEPVKTDDKMIADAKDTKPATVAKPKPGTEKKAERIQYDTPAWLNRIDFSSEDAGKSALIIGTTRPVKYDLIKVSDNRLNLQLFDTNLPDYRKRALITTRFDSAVDRVTPVQRKDMKNLSIVTIELREAVPYFAEQTDNLIRINFAASKIPPKPYEDADLPAWKKMMADPKAGPKAKSKMAAMTDKALDGAVKDPTKADRPLSLEERLAGASAGPKYTGEKIALDFYDTDIKNVFRILREISGKNFAIDKNVTGKVTLTLEKPVPWDQVLDLVLKMNQLGLTMEDDIVRIATLNTLAQEEKLRQAKIKAEQAAKKQEEALEPLITEYIPCNYSNAKNEVLPHIQNILTEGRGKISVDERNNQLIITDTAEKILQAKAIVDKIDQVTPQVIIEARIVEANSTFTRDLGFDWGEVTIGPFEVGDADVTFGLAADNIPPMDPSGSVGFDFLKLSGTPFTIIDAKLEVSETEGDTKIISAPKIVTLDNKKAKIKQGFEVPYLERDSSGNATVRFKDVDLLLEVTPNVTPDDRIVMSIFVTKNDLVDPTADEPALSTNEAETEILVDDGDTIVIGGILKSSHTFGVKGIPGLREIGVLGWLFKGESTEERKNELLIFITPRIVQLEQRPS